MALAPTFGWKNMNIRLINEGYVAVVQNLAALQITDTELNLIFDDKTHASIALNTLPSDLMVVIDDPILGQT